MHCICMCDSIRKGMQLHCKNVGPRNASTPAVVLLHGFNGSIFSW